MARQVGRHFPPDRSIEKIEVANQIENLVADKFIGESEFSIDDLFIIHQDEIIETSSTPSPHSFKHLPIF